MRGRCILEGQGLLDLAEPCRRVGLAGAGILLQSALNRPVQRRGQVGILDEPAQHGGHRPDVGADVDHSGPGLLGWTEPVGAGGDGEAGADGEVLAHPEIGDQQALVGAEHRRRRSDGIALSHTGDSAGAGQEQVPGAQIAVDQPGPMHRPHRGRQRPGKSQRILSGGAPALGPQILDALTQGAAVGDLEHQVRLLPGGLADVVGR